MHKGFAIKIFCLVIAIMTFVIIDFKLTKVQAIDFNPNNLISDGVFIDIGTLDANAIQRFLESENSYLKNFSENGRSAAQIIYDASHGYGEASGPPPDGCYYGICVNTSTGTINPQVILATLQKEQSLITKSDRDDGALNRAMGYACPDGGSCNSRYSGFTKQVENAAWQLRYNYERSSGLGFADYQVGQTIHFTNTYPNPYGGPAEQDIHLDNRATSALYRYTPHVYNGNYNFWNLYFNTFQFNYPEYSYVWVSQNAYPSFWPGEAYQFTLVARNTGYSTWQRGVVNLGTNNPQDRIPPFVREDTTNPSHGSNWISPNRVVMQQDTVSPGETATFSFWMSAPNDLAPGDYFEHFRLVADGITWMEDRGMFWMVSVKSEKDRYHYQWLSQNAYPTINQGEAYNFTINLQNTGATIWYKSSVNLGTNNPRDRIPSFVREDTTNPSHGSNWISPNRVVMQQDSVSPGETATFSFWMSAPNDLPSGTYREFFRLVADGITWMEELGIYWDVSVR